ncbi:hypothetical protein FDP41_013304 [Naegleria fowleri]|uniref:Protein phosphatase n=1 Tax=Naegleria fowleri TaxID=5763 RepID=A0A6A5C1F9_NAEFO|nr:uncharacterized protein FDP41_013304 [Naegleria fowleri]KAF0980821.1 hypothetical protein FDP41_013304 [Naegleria fowleri]
MDNNHHHHLHHPHHHHPHSFNSNEDPMNSLSFVTTTTSSPSSMESLSCDDPNSILPLNHHIMTNDNNIEEMNKEHTFETIIIPSEKYCKEEQKDSIRVEPCCEPLLIHETFEPSSLTFETPREEEQTICTCKKYRFNASVYGFSKSQYYDYSDDLLGLKEEDLNLGEDFYFYTNCTLGVSDGVGGWSSYGVDSSRVSKDIMNHCKYFAIEKEHFPNSEHSSLTPLNILSKAYYKEVEVYENLKINQPLGSTTACVLHMDEMSAALSYANLGDSGFIVLRRSSSDNQQRIIFTAKDKCRIINGLGKAPYQLSFLPPSFIQTNNYFNDKPTDAMFEANIISLQEGDIVIMGSDGLFENIKMDYLVELVNDLFPPGKPHNDMKLLSEELANEARRRDCKQDDIVCLCANVVYE